MVPIALSDADIQRMYREWSKLDAIRLERHGAGYTFDMARGPRFGFVEVMGNVDQLGRVSGVHQGTNFESCPICLVASAQVATPDGPVAASSIQVGEHVWTAGLDGRRLDAVVVRIGTNLAPPGSRLIHLVLLDGRELTASPAHQVEDGRALSSLKVGDPLAGGVITRLELVPEPFDRTYDLLPSGPTGEYWVDGILLRSTLSASSG
jgi:hypothetical protein